MSTPDTETDEQRADREETERDHARGDHKHCGVTCEAEMPTEHLRNFVIAKGYPGTAGALDELLRRARTEQAESDEAGLKTTARVSAALHRSAEEDVTRVIALYEQWVKASPPPLGAPLARWWDARLIELRQAIRPPEEEPVIGAESTVDAERLVDQNGKPICTCTYGERCSNCRD